MKISRLNVDNFAIEESPTVEERSIRGRDMLFYGGNRSGKTLIFNALLYALYGRRATFGVSPGQRSQVRVYFDTADSIIREGEHLFYHSDQELEATEGTKIHIGPKETVRLQFVPSDPAEQPLSKFSGPELLDLIRAILSSNRQAQIEKHRRAVSELKHLKEIRSRGERQVGIEGLEKELQGLPVQQTKNRLDEIRESEELINSGRIRSIRDRLTQKDQVTDSLDELYARRREISQTLDRKKNERSDISRYNQEVEDLIIDAIKELTCLICGRLVEEKKARNRLPNQCPQCGRTRDLDELRSELSEKVSTADDRIDELDSEIENLESELEEVEEEISNLQSKEPDLESLNPFIKTALDQADYDIDKLRERTQEELGIHQEELEKLEEQEKELSSKLNDRRELIASFDESIQYADQRISELEDEAREEVREIFISKLSETFQQIGSDLGTEVSLSPEGELQFPGAGSEGIRSYERLSSGERRLANLAFTITLAEFAQETEEAHNFEVLVLDEPMTDLELEVQNGVTSYLRDSNIQTIMTTSLDGVRSHFESDGAMIVPLNRIRTQDITLDEYL